MNDNDTATAPAAAGQPATVHYRADVERSTFTVQAFAGGLLSGLGHNPTIAIREFAADVQFEPATLAGASVRVVVEARSLEVTDQMSAKDHREITHTMFDDVLEVTRYHEVVFHSTSISATRVAEGRYKLRLVGDVTLHGVTRSNVWIPATVTVTGGELRATGDFALKQTDYGIKLVSVAGGVLKLKDELKFTFDVVGMRAPA